jgi:hypothetical protein
MSISHQKSSHHSEQCQDSLPMSARVCQFLRDKKSAGHPERSEGSLFAPCVLPPIAPPQKPVILSLPAQAGEAKDPSSSGASCHSLTIRLVLCIGGSLDPHFSSVSSVANPFTRATDHCLTVIPTGVEKRPHHPERSGGSLFDPCVWSPHKNYVIPGAARNLLLRTQAPNPPSSSALPQLHSTLLTCRSTAP